MPEKSSPPNWTYLNGKVAIGEHPHTLLFRQLADQDGLDSHTRGKIHGLWAGARSLELGLPCDVARGHMSPKGHAVFWESNVDRNAVRDAVEQRYREAGGGSSGQMGQDSGHTSGNSFSSVRVSEADAPDWVLYS